MSYSMWSRSRKLDISVCSLSRLVNIKLLSEPRRLQTDTRVFIVFATLAWLQSLVFSILSTSNPNTFQKYDGMEEVTLNSFSG